MQIDPKYSFWFGVFTSILLGLATGAVNLPSSIPHDIATQITGWCAFFGWINSVILTALNGYSSSKSGPLTAIPAPAPTTIAKVLLVAFALSFLLAGAPANAQGKKPFDLGQKIHDDLAAQNAKAAAVINGTSTDPDVSCDFKMFLGLTPKNLEKTIKKCLSDVNNTLADDITRALESAKAFTQTGSQTASPDNDAINCLTPALALVKAGTQIPAVPAQEATATSPAVPAVPAKNPGVILLFQKYREFVLAGALTACKTWVDTPVNATVVQGINNAAGIATGAALLLPK